MKKKLPYILNFENLYELYNNIGIDNTQYIPLWRTIDELNNDEPRQLIKEQLDVKNIWERKQKRVLEVITKYKSVIDEMEDAMLELVQLKVMIDPQIYVARTKDIKTGIEYFTAKTFLPLKGGKKKELKIYVGKAKDFNNNTTDEGANALAKRKMRPAIARRIVV
jgi:hypothetical protein